MTLEETQRIFLQAAGHRWLLPLYDPLTRLMGVDKAHRRSIEPAHIRSISRVLEIGRGTENLVARMKQIYSREPVSWADSGNPLASGVFFFELSPGARAKWTDLSGFCGAR